MTNNIPATKFSRLSLDTMPPTTRSRGRRESVARGSAAAEVLPPPPLTSSPPRREEEERIGIIISQGSSLSPPPPPPSSSSSSEYDFSENSDDDGDDSSIAESPSRLLYRLDRLPESKRKAVRDVFTDPPKVALQHCRRIDHDTYAFQMTELVPRSVRIHHDSSSRRTWLSCSCNPETTVSATDSPEDGGASRLGGDFCPHLVWLLDQVLGQTMYHHNRDEPLVMRSTGYARELGDPFDSIRHHSLEILAAGLHCPLVIDPSRRDGVDRTRALETRELLSSVHHVEPDQFRPDIFGVGHGVPAAMEEEGDQGDEDQEEEREEEYHGDLDLYIARMLLDNGHLFNYFVSRSKPSDPINNPFRKLSQRVDLVMHRLDQVTSTATRGQRSGKSNDPDPDPDPVTPSVVAWAAHHVAGCVRLIRSAVFSRHRPLTAPQALSAASTLVHILEAVATRDRDTRLPTPRAPRAERNLYLRMIGDRDDDFVLGVLALIPQAASQFVHDLERLLDSYITVQGAPTSYVSRFRALLARLRTSGTGAGLKRRGPREEGTGAERGPKRMK